MNKKQIAGAALALSAAALLTTAATPHQSAPTVPDGTHCQGAMVTGLDYDRDVVTVETKTGFVFRFDGCEDYAEGDIVAMLMWDNSTPETIEDDLILYVNYSGFYVKGGETK